MFHNSTKIFNVYYKQKNPYKLGLRVRPLK